MPTKIFASLSREDQQQADEPHCQPHRKEIPIQRPNQLYRRKYSEDFIKLGFASILINDERCLLRDPCKRKSESREIATTY